MRPFLPRAAFWSACLTFLLACEPKREPVSVDPNDATTQDAAVADSSADTGPKVDTVPVGTDASTDSADVAGTDAAADTGPSTDGQVATDTATADASADVAADTSKPDAGTCACDASSCGNQKCGNSFCGFDCGTCGTGSYCSLGLQCLPGKPPGSACTDAWGGAVWEGGKGYVACPDKPGQVRPCTCTGGGANAWINCGSCVASCP